MRKITALILALLITVSLCTLCSCQNKPSESAPSPSGDPQDAGWDGTVPDSYDFCFGWETDTQYYSRQTPRKYIDLNQWIADNASSLKMKYLIHTGDLINDYDMLYQWELANYAMGLLELADLPYGVLAGNHDVGLDLLDYEYYHRYFGQDRFVDQPWYGGSYDNNTGHYDLISAGGIDFIVLYMGWGLQQPELDWLNQVLAEYSDRKAILCFHGYTNVKPDEESGSLLNPTGQLVQKEVVAKNSNVFMVLSGHYHGASYETAAFDDDGDGTAERTVYQICTDYQVNADSGEGYVKMLYFNLAESKIYLSSYSPSLDDYNVYDDNGPVTLDKGGQQGVDTDKLVIKVDLTE